MNILHTQIAIFCNVHVCNSCISCHIVQFMSSLILLYNHFFFFFKQMLLEEHITNAQCLPQGIETLSCSLALITGRQWLSPLVYFNLTEKNNEKESSVFSCFSSER